MKELLDMDRRALLQRALLLAGASVAVSGCDMLAGSGNDKSFAFQADQFVLLSAVAGTIVPKTDTSGAIEAGVPKTFESLLRNWASSQTRDKIVGALDRIDDAARKKSSKGFSELDEARRLELLKAHDVHALEIDPDGTPVKGSNPFAPVGPPQNDPGYARMKELIVTLYYYSEAGLTEELAYEHDPGVWEPSIPITPETRPWGGLGLF
tara:strand:+ start:937 stop:1563 length:627 start_codon:yes stop_codon:yes gene_type:complete